MVTIGGMLIWVNAISPRVIRNGIHRIRKRKITTNMAMVAFPSRPARQTRNSVSYCMSSIQGFAEICRFFSTSYKYIEENFFERSSMVVGSLMAMSCFLGCLRVLFFVQLRMRIEIFRNHPKSSGFLRYSG